MQDLIQNYVSDLHKLREVFHKELELDRIYSAIGAIGAEGRRNYTEVLQAGMEPISQRLGSRAEAEKLIADLLAYLDRPDTNTYSLFWMITARAPTEES
jgi:hypothetical protein